MKNKRKSGLKWILAVWFCGISAMADAQVTEGLKAIGMENIRCAQTPGMTTVSFENNVYRSTYTGVGKAIDACLGSKTKGDLQLVVLENRIPRLCINLPDTLTEAYRNGEINLTQVYQQMGITVDTCHEGIEKCRSGRSAVCLEGGFGDIPRFVFGEQYV